MSVPALTCEPVSPPESSATDVSRGVPWYIHPAEAPRQWAELPTVLEPGDFVVVNPHNGPGDPSDPYYPRALGSLGAVRTVGYVDIDYGSRPMAAIDRDVRQWVEGYGIREVMLDQVPSSMADGDRVTAIVGLARARGARQVYGNPGTLPAKNVLEAFDVVCTAEMPAAVYLREYAEMGAGYFADGVPESRRDAGPDRWHLIHSCPAHLRQEVISRARSAGVRYLHVTSQELPNPWRGWDDGVAPEACPTPPGPRLV